MAERHTVMIGFPGPTMGTRTSYYIYHANTRKHDKVIGLAPWEQHNFDAVWCTALNKWEAGDITHLAFLHSDVEPQEYWIDILLDECDRLGAHIVAAATPIKDFRGHISTAIGHPDNPFALWRVVTMHELWNELPETFNGEDLAPGYPADKYPFLWNSGAAVIDLRDGMFAKTTESGELIAWFDFPRTYGRMPDGTIGCRGLRSEDYHFAACCHKLGAKAYVTRKLRLLHRGPWTFSNGYVWGAQKHDENNACHWVDGDPRVTLAEPDESKLAEAHA